MTVISITITPSLQTVLPDLPALITISTNIPAIIFYTLDGETPNTDSPVYVAPIVMPELLSVTLSVVATNGNNTSDVVVQTYTADASQIKTIVGDRLPHATVQNLDCNASNNSLFPFGSNSPIPNVEYGNPGNAGTTVYNQSLPTAVSQGFDGAGNPAVFTNKPKEFYQFNEIYSTTNYEGEILPGTGNLPAPVQIIGSQYPQGYNQTSSSTADKLFDPRALVIYDDSTTADPTNPALIMRQNFSLQDNETYRDGALFYGAALDQTTTTAVFVNRAYNSRTNMVTNSYFDSTMNRWVFTSSPYQPTTPGLGNLSRMVFGRGEAGNKVFSWKWGYFRTLT